MLITIFIFQRAACQMKLGIHGGMNTSSIDPQIAGSEFNIIGSVYSYSSPKTGYYVGIFTELKLSNYLSLLLECGYSKKRYEEITTSVIRLTDPFKTTRTTQLGITEIGSLVMYGLPLGTGKLSIGAGGKAAYILSGNTRVISNTRVGTSDGEEKVSKKFVPGLLGTVNYEFRFGLSLDLKYDYLIKAQPDIDLSVFSFGAGYIFHFKGKKKN